MPAFAQDSYMQVESLNASNVESEMTVEILFYASLPDGEYCRNGCLFGEMRTVLRQGLLDNDF